MEAAPSPSNVPTPPRRGSRLVPALVTLTIVFGGIGYLFYSSAGEAFEYYKHVDEVAQDDHAAGGVTHALADDAVKNAHADILADLWADPGAQPLDRGHTAGAHVDLPRVGRGGDEANF